MLRIIAIVLGIVAAVAAQGQKIDWAEITGPTQAKIPAPLDEVEWRDNLGKALELAKEENRPLFVTLRCLPCKQCSAFDKDVLEGGAELTPVLRQFVTVRLTDANAMDLRLLPIEGYQDMDLSWWGYLLSPQGQLYAIFGGKDHISDATRISEAALISTLKRVLEHHYDPRREKWNVDGTRPDLTGQMQRPRDLPGHKSWISKTHLEAKQSACLHCHQVAEVLRQPALDLGKFDKNKDTQVWPLPENVGLVVDRDHGLKVTQVLRGSAAAKAAMKAGDVLAAAGGRKLFGQADFRGVLHRAPRSDATIEVHFYRDGRLMNTQLEMEEGWKKTVLDWRMSISQGNIGADAGFFPLALNKNERARLKLGEDEMGVKPFMYKEPTAAAKAGLRGNHVMVAVNGESPNVAGRAFQWWFRQRFEAGSKVVLTVREGEKTKQIEYQLPRE